MKRTTWKAAAAIGLTGLALSASSNAATVLIDWSTVAPVSSPAGDGKYWNSVGLGQTAVASTALVDTTGAASGISVSVTLGAGSTGGGGAGFSGTGANNTGSGGADPFDELNAFTDGIFANNNTKGIATINFTGLVPNTNYDFAAIGGRDSGTATNGLISVILGTSTSSSYTLLDDETVLDFSITSTAGGAVSFTFAKSSSDTTESLAANFNALSIVPEPSAALLGGLGLLALLRRRRA